MFGLNPVVVWLGIALLATNLFTLTAWRMEVAAHALTKAQDANERVAQAEQAAQRMQEAPPSVARRRRLDWQFRLSSDSPTQAEKMAGTGGEDGSAKFVHLGNGKVCAVMLKFLHV